MKNFIKVTGIILLGIAIAYPTYDLTKEFVNNRNLMVKNTHYNFSKYLRYSS